VAAVNQYIVAILEPATCIVVVDSPATWGIVR
jgi:hypothetical protein